ncbi:NAD-dependent epimerase/dehydratase family protein [Shivajiella indica]|uniref:NAD-dependent epimerase/dehydratase family protein n=1 Tax=Shivajiella indica TaxID=872115 RepID=A0ABW5B302_9BACT
MKILITGATGLFGNHLVRKFAIHAEIHALVRKDSNKDLISDYSDQIIWHEGSLNDVVSLEEALKDMDMVIHAAGHVSFDPKEDSMLMSVNTEGTANLVNSMLQQGIKKLIHISSVSALGRSPEVKSINETNRWTKSDFNTPYATSKYFADLEVWRGVQEGIDALIVYPSVLLGKISDQRSSSQIYNYVLEGRSYYPKGSVNYIDVRDAAEIVWQLYQKGVWNEGYILNKESLPYKVFFEKMSEVFNTKAPHKEVKPWMLNLVIAISWIGKKLGLSKSPLNKQTAMLSQLEVYMDNSKVLELLDFNFRPLEDTFSWAKANEIN